MTIKEALKHINRMLDLRDKAHANNMAFYYTDHDREAIRTLRASTQVFSKRISEFLETH